MNFEGGCCNRSVLGSWIRHSLFKPPSVFLSKETNVGRCITAAGEENIIQNPDFEDGLTGWSGRGCKILAHESMEDGKVLPPSGKFFASATDRAQSWNGIQQEITGRAQRKRAYDVTALVRTSGNSGGNAEVRATLWIQSPSDREQYIGVGK